MFDDILPAETDMGDNRSAISDWESLPDPEEDMMEAAEYAKAQKTICVN